MGGFQQYNPAEDKSFENMLRALLYQQFQKLHAMDLIKEQLTYKELSAQVDTCDGLKKFFKDFTGHEFVYEVWCDRDVPHCNERRGFSNGENHKHPVVIERPTVDFSVYEGVAALRREVMRLGLSPSTGTEVDPPGTAARWRSRCASQTTTGSACSCTRPCAARKRGPCGTRSRRRT